MAKRANPFSTRSCGPGGRTGPVPTLEDIRDRAAKELARLPEPLRSLEPNAEYRVEVGKALRELTASFDRYLQRDGKP